MLNPNPLRSLLHVKLPNALQGKHLLFVLNIMLSASVQVDLYLGSYINLYFAKVDIYSTYKNYLAYTKTFKNISLAYKLSAKFVLLFSFHVFIGINCQRGGTKHSPLFHRKTYDSSPPPLSWVERERVGGGNCYPCKQYSASIRVY